MPQPEQLNRESEQEYRHLTADDRRDVDAYFLKYASATFLSAPPSSLVHYTTGENLIRIIGSQSLWSTQVSCLNDTTEFAYATASFAKRVKSRLSDPHDVRIHPFLKRLDEVLRDARPDTVSTFVTCFSQVDDDLSQWRAYSGGEGGYAIRFNPLNLVQSGMVEIRQIIGRVEYSPAKHDAIFRDVLAHGEDFFLRLRGARLAESEDSWTSEFIGYWLNSLIALAPFIKHPKFAAEQEWRFVYFLQKDDADRMQFRQRQTMMTRHVPLRLAGRLPIEGVRVGPCRHPELSRVAVGDLLKKHGYDPDVVKVEISEVPYRAL